MSTPRFKYTGTVPAADANNYTLFDTTAMVGMGGNFFSMTNVSRFKLLLRHAAAGTVTWYRSMDRGRIWQKEGSEYLPTPLPPAYHDLEDWSVEGAKDWKLVWTNGGVAQRAILVAVGVDFTALAMATFQGLVFSMDVDGTIYTIDFPLALANTAAVLAYINACLLNQAGAAVCVATTAGGTGLLTLTNQGLGTESTLKIIGGTIALATLGFTAVTNDQANSWQVEMNGTTERHHV